MKEIILKGGSVAIVDDDVFEIINHHNWLLMKSDGVHKDYAYRWTQDTEGKRRRVFMHREVLPHDLPHTDHKDGNGLNNQKENLRSAFCFQNLANRGAQSNNTSGFKGVVWRKKTQKWLAQINDRRIKMQIHLGVFTDKISAALAYDRAAVKMWGEFAVTNFPINKPPTETTE